VILRQFHDCHRSTLLFCDWFGCGVFVGCRLRLLSLLYRLVLLEELGAHLSDDRPLFP